MRKEIQRWFRTKRNKDLSKIILNIHAREGRPVSILDVGGSPFFWETVPSADKANITLLNREMSKARPDYIESPLRDRVKFELGDGTDIHYPDKSFDLVTCNSVIEHVGSRDRMMKMASELERVGIHGWVQVPAYEFPIEPHFRLPFIHWFSQPTRSRMLKHFGGKNYRRMSAADLKSNAQRINLLTKQEFVQLFRAGKYYPERFVIVKSHMMRW